MREIRPYGSVRGARSNARPYRDSKIKGHGGALDAGRSDLNVPGNRLRRRPEIIAAVVRYSIAFPALSSALVNRQDIKRT